MFAASRFNCSCRYIAEKAMYLTLLSYKQISNKQINENVGNTPSMRAILHSFLCKM